MSRDDFFPCDLSVSGARGSWFGVSGVGEEDPSRPDGERRRWGG